jgi:class 3 adenylate cyclase
MGLKEELVTFVKKTIDDGWKTRDGEKVPTTEDLSLGNHAVKLEATVLYADLAESTAMVKNYNDWFAAEVYKNYLYCATKIIRALGGAITAYDGDRVMAVFIGGSKNSNAAKSALKINYACTHVIQPAIKAKHPTSSFILKQKVGIDKSPLFIARTGIRGNNDLVWVGTAANNAAKMAALSASYSSYVSATVYNALNDSAKIGNDGRNMWTDLGSGALGTRIYGSTWWWSI